MSYQVTKEPVPTNHILHLILTLVTCGFWAPVWLVIAIINANTDRTTTTRTYGVQPVQALPAPPAATGPMCYAAGCPNGHYWHPARYGCPVPRMTEVERAAGPDRG